MPRPEGPLGPGRPEVEDFAAGLRRLREKAGGPGYRELARRAHFSATTLSDAAGGRRLPTLAVTLAFVDACGGDVAEWERRWREVEAGAAPAAGDTPPYQGLAPYGPDRAEWFFGRSELVADLVGKLCERRLLAVFGASGSGKSSLLRAGLVPALGGHPLIVFTPGADPYGELAVGLARHLAMPAGTVRADLLAAPGHLHLAARQILAAEPAGADLHLVIDQFEELFTLCHDAPARSGFVAALLAAAGAPDSRVRVVLGVRADYYGRCAELAGLPEALAGAQVLVGPMTAAQVREAVVRPAERSGAMVEGSLVSTVVAQVAGHTGALPMASHALLEAWRRRRGSAMTLAGYEAAGGVGGAVAQTAERVWAELTDDGRRAARYLLSRLVEVGDGDEAPTGRRVDRAEVAGAGAATAAVLDRLAAARLLTVDDRSVRLAHEALITAWPRLRGWLDEDRDGMRVHRRLTEAAAVWRSLSRDPGGLYRGVSLSRAGAFADAHPAALTADEREFLDASRRDHERALAARRRRGRVLLGTLAAVVAVVTTLATVAAAQAGRARQQRDDAARGRLVADVWARLDRDPADAFRLARQAYAARPDAASGAALRQATLAWRGTGAWQAFGPRVTTGTMSPDGRYVLAVTSPAGGASTVQLWDRSAPDRAPVTLPGVSGRVYGVALSPDGSMAAGAQRGDGAVRLWPLRPVGPPRLLPGHAEPLAAGAFSPDGRLLATVDGAGVTRLWDVSGARPAVVRVLPGSGRGFAAAISPDGARLAVATEGRPARVWDLRQPVSAPRELPDSTDSADDLAFSPDGSRVAGWTDNGDVRVWRLAGGPPVTLGRLREAQSPVFTPDGRRVLVRNAYGAIAVFDASAEGAPMLMRGHQGGVWAATVTAGGEVVSLGADGTVRTWDIGGPYRPEVSFPDPADLTHAVAFSPDGRRLATGGISDGEVRVFPVAGGTPVVLGGHDGIVLDLAFAPSGNRLASVDAAGTVRVWALPSPRPVASFNAGGATRVAFTGPGDQLLTSGDEGVRRWDAGGRGAPVALEAADAVGVPAAGGARLLTGSGDGVVRIRDAGGRELAAVRGHDGPVSAVAVSPDGRRAASLGVDSTIRSWPMPRRGGDRIPVVVHDAAGEGTTTSRLAFTADGGHLAVLGGTELMGVQFWSATAGVDPVTVRALGPAPMSFALGPDGRRVATVHVDGSVRLWDCEVCGTDADLLAVAATRATTIRAVPGPSR